MTSLCYSVCVEADRVSANKQGSSHVNKSSFLNVIVVTLVSFSAMACGAAQSGNLNRSYYFSAPAGAHPIADSSEVEIAPEMKARYQQLQAEMEGQPIEAGSSHFVADERKRTPKAVEVKSFGFNDRNTSCTYMVKNHAKIGTFATAQEAETAFQSWITKQPCTGKACDEVVKVAVIMDCNEDRLAKVSSN